MNTTANLINTLYEQMTGPLHQEQGEPINFGTKEDETMEQTTTTPATTIEENLLAAVARYYTEDIEAPQAADIADACDIGQEYIDAAIAGCQWLTTEDDFIVMTPKGMAQAVENGWLDADEEVTPVDDGISEAAGGDIAVKRGWAVQTCLRCDDAVRDADVNEDGWCEDCVSLDMSDAERVALVDVGLDDVAPDTRYGTAEDEVARDEEANRAATRALAVERFDGLDEDAIVYGNRQPGDFVLSTRGKLRFIVSQGKRTRVIYQKTDGTWSRGSEDPEKRCKTCVSVPDLGIIEARVVLLLKDSEREALGYGDEPAPENIESEHEQHEAEQASEYEAGQVEAAAEEAEWRKAATLAAFPELAFGYVDEDESDLPPVGHEFGDCDDRSFALEQRISKLERQLLSAVTLGEQIANGGIEHQQRIAALEAQVSEEATKDHTHLLHKIAGLDRRVSQQAHQLEALHGLLGKLSLSFSATYKDMSNQ